MENLIIIVLLAIVVFGAVFYVYKEKKSGRKCIGCPSSGSCGKKQCDCEK